MRENFEQERLNVRKLLERLSSKDPALGERRILIDRLQGLEDSSRYWSVWMTLDHLRIVNDSISMILKTLGKGKVPEGVARTEDVKPGFVVGAEIVELYERSCDQLLEIAGAVSNLRTTVAFDHPWFGPLDAGGWYTLAGVHLGIHRKQIERIMDRLSQESSES